MQRIQTLTPLIANQIAAGEVVERPASVVKELLENSLDATATQIDIEISQAGKRLIRITDNGDGVHRDDLPLALSRHATSKILALDDLSHINSLGFRGEALASIASVSKLMLTSNTGDAAWQVESEGEKQVPIVMAASHPKGTSISVRELFYNTPVRRKFLRTDKTEWLQIEDVVKRIALSHFDVGFKLTHGDKLIFNLPPAERFIEQEKRVAKLCGHSFLQTAMRVEEEAEGLQLQGWVSKADACRAHTDVQIMFLNGRMVRDKLLNHALKLAVQNIVPAGRHLAYVLYLQCDPTAVDVNVHPTKHEVRFHTPRLIHDFVFRSVNRQYSTADVANSTKNFTYPYLDVPSQSTMIAESSIEYSTHRFGRFIGIAKQRYLLVENDEGLLLIDGLKAWEIMLKQQFDSGKIAMQPLLLPVTLKLNTRQLNKLKKLDVKWQQVTSENIALRQVPSVLEKIDWKVELPAALKKTDPLAELISLAASVKTIDEALLVKLQNLERDNVDLEACQSIIELEVKCLKNKKKSLSYV